MFALLLLVALFSLALSVEDGSLLHPPKCNETLVSKIYNYWQENGGVPQSINDDNIKCYPREIAVLTTHGVVEDDVTCGGIDHFPESSTVYIVKGNNVSLIRDIVTEEENGQLIEPISKKVRFEIAESGCARLLHFCSRHNDAKEGPNQFEIKSVEGKASEEGLKAMQDLLTNTFDNHETLRTFSETCPLPEEKPHPVEQCAKSSCTD